MKRIYLDHAATTVMRPEARAAVDAAQSAAPYNASSPHHEGRAARAILDDARGRTARALGTALAREIIFTASGSESITLALLGAAGAARERGRHIVASPTEHHAVLHSLDQLAAEGWEITYVAVDRFGRIDAAEFAGALRDGTVLATIMLANNETGTIAEIAALARVAHGRGALFHTDAVQTPGWIPLDAAALGVDLLSLAGHKFGGPKGAGALYVRDGTPLRPLIAGGAQEHGRRAGTEAVALCAGFASALELARAEQSAVAPAAAALRDRFERLVARDTPDVRFIAAPDRLPQISSMIFEGLSSEELLVRLDLEGMAASAGSACTSGTLEPSHVLAAIGAVEGKTAAALRVSLGRETTESEIDRAAGVVGRTVASLRKLSTVGL